MASPPHPPIVALARAMARQTYPATYCLQFVRERFGVASHNYSPGDARPNNAAEAWSHTAARHSSTPPRGVPVWWTGGEYGHVAISAGGGYVISTDWPRRGTVGRAEIRSITNRWSKRYRGWSEDINEVTVFVKPTVDLSDLVKAARLDPGRPDGGTTEGSVRDVRIVEAALLLAGLLDARWAIDGSFGSKTLYAYARWKGGRTANGIPDHDSLTRLGDKYGFNVRT